MMVESMMQCAYAEGYTSFQTKI